MNESKISPPDQTRIAEQRAVIDRATRARYGTPLRGGTEDLALLQRLLDDGVYGVNHTYELQSLGVVLGQVLADEVSAKLSWVTVTDEWGVDPALRYGTTTLLVFPLTMISKRLEEYRLVNVQELYDNTVTTVAQLAREGWE